MAGPQQQVNVKIQRALFVPHAKQKSIDSLQQRVAPMHLENRIGQTNHYLAGKETITFILGDLVEQQVDAQNECCQSSMGWRGGVDNVFHRALDIRPQTTDS
jgi:hypothetical protein